MFVADKKALIKIIFGHCKKATRIEIVLRLNCNVDCQARNLIKLLN